MAHETDARLAKAARAGDKDAFSQLVERHYGAVYGLAYASVGNWSAAEDIAQEAFLVAYANLRRLRMPGVFLMWLRRIVRNLSQDWIRSEVYRRKLAERMKIENEHNDVSNDTPATHLGRQERCTEAWDALRTLSSNVREAMVLFYIEGKSTAEAARSLGVTENAVRTRLYQGRKKLREHIETRIEAELRQGPPDNAADRILAALAIGPAVPQIGQAAAGASLGMWMHHLGHGGASALLKPAFTGGVIVSLKKVSAAAIIAILIGIGAYVGVTRNRERAPSAPRGQIPSRVAALSLSAFPEEPAEPEPARDLSSDTEEAVSAITRPDQPIEARSGVQASVEEPEHGAIENSADYCSISGFVTDEEGNGIAGAEVTVIATGYTPGEPGIDRYAARAVITKRTHHFHAKVAPDGGYEVTSISFSGTAIVSAYAEGYQAEGTALLLVPGDVYENVDVILSEGVTLRGRVLTVNGAPVTDAAVHSLAFVRPGHASGGSGLGFVRTDADGRFSLGFPAEGLCALRVVSETHGSRTFPQVPIGDEEVELIMEETATLTGMITWSDGMAAEGMVVSVHGESSLHAKKNGMSAMSGIRGTEHFATVDASGKYEISDIDSGAMASMATITTADGTPVSKEIELGTLAPGEIKVWNHVLEDTMIVVKGHVYGGQTGRALGDVHVSWQKEGSDAAGLRESVAGDGSYELRILAGSGEYLVYPEYLHGIPDDMAEQYGKIIELEVRDVAEVDLTLPDPVMMSIRAINSEGDPVSGASVTLSQRIGRSTNGYGISELTDENGRFSWSGFTPGPEVWCTVQHNDYLRAASAHHVGSPGEIFPEETVVLYRSSGVTGIALDTDGQPIPDAEIEILAHYAGDQRKRISCETDATGKFSRIEGVPATEVVFEIAVDDGAQEYSWTSDPVQCLPDHVTDFSEIAFSLVQEQTGDDK